jgi:hypothetical protein
MSVESRYLIITKNDLAEISGREAPRVDGFIILGVFGPSFNPPVSLSAIKDSGCLEIWSDQDKISSVPEGVSTEIASNHAAGNPSDFWVLSFSDDDAFEEFCEDQLSIIIGDFKDSPIPSPMTKQQRQRYLSKMALKEFIQAGWVTYPFLVCTGSIAEGIRNGVEFDLKGAWGSLKARKRPVILTGLGL